jgi:hypothetical protein
MKKKKVRKTRCKRGGANTPVRVAQGSFAQITGEAWRDEIRDEIREELRGKVSPDLLEKAVTFRINELEREYEKKKKDYLKDHLNKLLKKFIKGVKLLLPYILNMLNYVKE